jgi:D-arabinose 5-phosphate isomerase GutQ
MCSRPKQRRSVDSRDASAAFLAAARALFECRGRAVVTGIGKSAHIARKHLHDLFRAKVA